MNEYFFYYFTNKNTDYCFLPFQSKKNIQNYYKDLEQNIKITLKSLDKIYFIDKSLKNLSNVDLLLKTKYTKLYNIKDFYFPYTVVLENNSENFIKNSIENNPKINSISLSDNFWKIFCSINSFIVLKEFIENNAYYKKKFSEIFYNMLKNYELNKILIKKHKNTKEVIYENKKNLYDIIKDIDVFYKKNKINHDYYIHEINLYDYINYHEEDKYKNKFFIHNLHHDCMILKKIKKYDLHRKYNSVLIFDIRTDLDKDLEQKIKKVFCTFFKKNEKRFFSFKFNFFIKTLYYFTTKEKEDFEKEINYIFNIYDIKNIYTFKYIEEKREKLVSYFNILDMNHYKYYEKVFF